MLIYKILENNQPQCSKMLREVSQLKKDSFNKAFMELLEKLYITSFSSYKSININWSSFLYTTSINWENNTALNKIDYSKEKAKENIYQILEKTMKKSDVEKIVQIIS